MMKKLLLSLSLLACFSAFADHDCQKTGTVCTAPNQTRVVGGQEFFRECWEYEDTYQCRSQETVNDCQPLRDKGCVQLGSNCIDRDRSGACLTYEQKYNCPDKPETATERTVCDQSAFCLNGSGCFDTSAPPDQDFGQAAVMMEAAREAGVYGIDPNKVEIFKGYMEECSIKVLGGSKVKSCCNSASGGAAFTNNALLGAGAAVANEAGSEAIAMGSKYMYDALYGQLDSALMDRGLGAMNSWASTLGDGAFNPQFGFYGFTFEFSFANGFQFTGFDPYTMALSVAIMLIQEWLSCDSTEQVMALKRGQNLCVHVDTYCSKKAFVCVERKERHCCFNSKLAKIINRQGREQLGMPMNTCSGFNQEQLQALDFTRIDLSEFIADIVPKEVSGSAMSERARETVDRRVKGYYDQ